MKQIRPLASPEDYDREWHDTANALYEMAIAEAGYPIKGRWDGRLYRDSWVIPEDIRRRARLLVFEKLGVAYEVVDEDEEQ